MSGKGSRLLRSSQSSTALCSRRRRWVRRKLTENTIAIALIELGLCSSVSMKPVVNYILQSQHEPTRLLEQSKLGVYDLNEELAGIDIQAGAKVLDVGCGAGCLIEYLDANYAIQGVACDLLQAHVDFCRERLPKRIVCMQHDILKGSPPGVYDHMFLRYVAHHIGADAIVACLQHLRDALNPRGRLTCIDTDGILINLGTMDVQLRAFIKRIQANFSGDVEIARKLPRALQLAGFTVETTRVQTIIFAGSARREEVEQWRQRFENAREAYTAMLGSDADYQAFVRLYLSELSDESVPYYVTKFIVTGSVA